jgi:uncharacterized protein DUF1376
MPSLPWYKWYPAKWLSSETRLGMTLAERSIYRDLLDALYEKGSLPSDRRVLAQIAGASSQEFDLAWAVVGLNFIPCEDDATRLTNSVAADVLRSRSEMADAGRAAGIASGVSRRAARRKPPNDDATNPSTIKIKTKTQTKIENNNYDLDSHRRSAFADTPRADLSTLTSLIHESLGREPSQSAIGKIMDAAGGASEPEVISAIRAAYERGYGPGSKNAPRTCQWFEVVVFEAFHRGETLLPALPAVSQNLSVKALEEMTAAIDTTE